MLKLTSCAVLHLDVTAELIYVIYVLNVHIKRSVCQNTWLSLICSLITFLTWEVILWCFIKEEREPICLILFYDVKWGINEDAIKQVAQKLSLRHTCNTTVHVSCIPYAVDDFGKAAVVCGGLISASMAQVFAKAPNTGIAQGCAHTTQPVAVLGSFDKDTDILSCF